MAQGRALLETKAALTVRGSTCEREFLERQWYRYCTGFSNLNPNSELAREISAGKLDASLVTMDSGDTPTTSIVETP